jgi:hypothetical protein
MQTTERPPTGPTRANSPVRGVVLVAVAVVLGFFVLRAIDDTGGAPGVPDETAATTGEEAAEGETPESTEAAAPQPRPVGEVTVLVANGSGVSGAAAQQTELLAGAGYVTLEGTNAPAELAATEVLVVPGYEADGAALAAAINAPPESVKAMPDPPPLDPGEAQILVMLGPDLASG